MMSALRRVSRAAATDATVIGMATTANNATPARTKLPSGSRALMASPKEIPLPSRADHSAVPGDGNEAGGD